MPPEPDPGAAERRWARAAAAVWAAVLVAVCARGAWQPGKHSLYATYAAAGRHWLAAEGLYAWDGADPNVDSFRYSPLVAALLAPFSRLPAGTGGVLWRLLNGAALLGGFAAWVRTLPGAAGAGRRARLFLLLVPLALASLNNGQVNPMMTGLLLGAAAAAARGRWSAGAACVALATALKVYPLALGLLLAAAYPRRFAPRLLLAVAAAAALPFLLGPPGYVAGQYAEWARLLAADDRTSWPPAIGYRDLWLLLKLAGAPVGPRAYLAVQMAAGAGCAVLCVAGRLRGWPREKVCAAALALGTCWMALLGPATESCTYVVLGPALAWALVDARAGPWPAGLRRLPDAALALLMLAVLAGLSPFTREVHARGPHPLGALLLFAGYAGAYARALAAPGGPAAAPAAARAA
jgi:hypothetical protein